MRFFEKQENGKLTYLCDDIFGTLEITSDVKLPAETLDQVFMAVFKLNIKSVHIEGKIENQNINYKLTKKPQWIESSKSTN